jgi:hypothetical protein
MSKVSEIIISSGVSTGLLVALGFILKNWFLERLKGAIKQEYAKDLEDHKNNLRRETDLELTKLRGNVEVEVKKAELKFSLYSQKQFELYNDLWLRLCELRTSMNELWQEASNENLWDFQGKLLKAFDVLEQKAILIEEQHYDELHMILKSFANYHMGKKTLIDARREKEGMIDSHTIEQLINHNMELRGRLLSYLGQMKNCLRSQICGQPNMRGN